MNTTAKPKILIIDDDDGIRNSSQRLLSREFDVSLSKSLTEGKTTFASDKFAIVICDQSLPDGEGIKFFRELAETESEATRVLISGSVELEVLSKAINSGAVHRLIIKPWDNDYFRLQVLEAMQSHNLLKEKNKLSRLAITDPITELYNHRKFQDALKVEEQRALRHGRKLALLMIDIDHFKNFNDKHGHPAGDHLLYDLSKRVLKSVRNLDIVARYGGEEFAVLMPDTSGTDALTVAERIRISLESQPFEVFHSPEGTPKHAKITVSIGVASLKPNSSLVEDADRALYSAKNSGRNRSVLDE